MSVDLTKIVWSEAALAELLGAKRTQIRNLRASHGLPFVRLQMGLRAYLADDVLNWLLDRRMVVEEAPEDGPASSVGDSTGQPSSS